MSSGSFSHCLPAGAAPSQVTEVKAAVLSRTESHSWNGRTWLSVVEACGSLPPGDTSLVLAREMKTMYASFCQQLCQMLLLDFRKDAHWLSSLTGREHYSILRLSYKHHAHWCLLITHTPFSFQHRIFRLWFFSVLLWLFLL